ncbi:MAG: YtxH domain-containing protein [Deltaproteobacteria bacterium]|nr:YtxH domain-containing protein [Deltaproteobacteria bacterium]
MKLDALGDLTKDDILGALGLSKQRTTGDRWMSALPWFGAGLVVGAAVTLVLAPKSGRDLRGDLRDKFQSVRKSVTRQVIDGTAKTDPGVHHDDLT